jgi:hypothetical protein
VQITALSGRAGLDEARLVGEHDDLHPVAEAELAEDVGDVGLDGRFADDEGVRCSIVDDCYGRVSAR